MSHIFNYQKLNIMQKEGLKALIFGSTGAVGSELVQILLANPNWQKVHCIVRKKPEEWQKLAGRQKLTLQEFENLDDYFKKENNQYSGYDSLFCCFGSQVKHGEETFIKVDKTYPLWVADIALRNKIPHYLLVSSMGSSASSWFLYPRTKGQVEEQLKTKGLNLLTIFRPGLLKHRKDARIGQKIFGIFPFVPKIQARECADVLRIIAQRYHQESFKSQSKVNVLENSDMLNVLEK